MSKRGGESDRSSWWYITSNNVYRCTTSGSKIDYTREVTLTKESSNVIKLVSSSETFYLYPKSRPDSSFSGDITIVSSTTSNPKQSINLGNVRAISGIGGIQIVVSNANDAAQTSSTTTDNNGDFTVAGISAEDNYEVIVDQTTVNVVPGFDGTNIGTISIAEGVNFKLSGKSNSNVMIAGGNAYTGTITINNIGTNTASACNYILTSDEGDTQSSTIGSIASNKSSTITISSLKCKNISTEKHFKKYSIVINDPINKKTWNDSVSFLFYKSTISLDSFYSGNGGISGIIYTPEGISYPFGIRATTSVTVPKLSGDYIIAIAGCGLNSKTGLYEAIYGLSLSTFSTKLSSSQFNTQASSFTETGNYEPNNTEDAAFLISSPVVSYLHDGDLDYYKIHL